MTRSLNIATIAEGVETARQLGALQRERCPEVQGFLLGRAMDTDAASAFLSDGRTAETVRASMDDDPEAQTPPRPP